MAKLALNRIRPGARQKDRWQKHTTSTRIASLRARFRDLKPDMLSRLIRPWRKPPPPMWLDLADELGVLTVGSLAIECMDFPNNSLRTKASGDRSSATDAWSLVSHAE
jgi:hypothetical protein